MMMTPNVRKLGLTAHVVFSVGWLGAVAGFLALAVGGLLGDDGQRARAAYVAMQPVTWFVIVPFCVASLLTGIVQALGTPWGLFRHWWVLIKLSMTALSTILLMLHTRAIDMAASMAADATSSLADLGGLRVQLVIDSAAALVVLVVTTVLAVYKPRGVTVFASRTQHRQTIASQPSV